MSERYWILNPAGHRLAESRAFYGRDGEMVKTVFGDAVLIVPPQPEADAWYCDLCSAPILTTWGGEPFPVPMLGSYALCAEHYYEAQTWEEEDEEGNPIPGLLLGLWPPFICGCDPCREWMERWRPQLEETWKGAYA